jgi:hypothetical protein
VRERREQAAGALGGWPRRASGRLTAARFPGTFTACTTKPQLLPRSQ